MNDVIFEPIGTNGDLMPLQEFIECVEWGGFIDYDGWGYLATETGKSDIVIYPSEVEGYVLPEWCTHVLWYNK